MVLLSCQTCIVYQGLAQSSFKCAPLGGFPNSPLGCLFPRQVEAKEQLFGQDIVLFTHYKLRNTLKPVLDGPPGSTVLVVSA